MKCPECSAENPDDALVCRVCGYEFQHNPFEAPPQEANSPAPAGSGEGDSTGGIIPYKNPSALISYYLGIASGLPLIGLPIGIVALILGIKGLRDRKKNPAIKGSVHAGIGIGCGTIFTILWSIIIIGLIIGAAAG